MGSLSNPDAGTTLFLSAGLDLGGDSANESNENELDDSEDF